MTHIKQKVTGQFRFLYLYNKISPISRAYFTYDFLFGCLTILKDKVANP